MVNRKLCRSLALSAAVLAAAIIAQPQPKPVVEVWAVGQGDNKVYHCPGSRWFGVGEGKRMGECGARQQGYRPAFGTGCGSPCMHASGFQFDGSKSICSTDPGNSNGSTL